MSQVVSFVDYRPTPRYDSLPWTAVNVEEGASSAGPWGLIDTLPLAPLDADPSQPGYRNFTTSLASDTPALWYRLVFIDAALDTGLPTTPIQNVDDERPIYASTSELAQRLRVSEADEHVGLLRVLKSAAREIDHEIGTADISGVALPYSAPPDIVVQVNLERAVEHWRQMKSPFGVVNVPDLGPVYTARNSWDRHAHELSVLKGESGFGIA